MARRKSKKTRTRRSAKNINILNIAESALIANAVTVGLFNTNIKEFITGTTNYGSDGSTVLSLPELLGIDRKTGKSVAFGGNYGAGYSLSSVLQQNLRANGGKMLGQLILIPIGFKAVTKLTSKPRSTINKGLKMTGLPMKV